VRLRLVILNARYNLVCDREYLLAPTDGRIFEVKGQGHNGRRGDKGICVGARASKSLRLLRVSQHPVGLWCAVACVVGLGYHRDPQTRAAFMEVLTKILQQGTEFETLAETVLADRFERLVELVTMIGDKGELPIAMALASVVANPHMVPTHSHRSNDLLFYVILVSK